MKEIPSKTPKEPTPKPAKKIILKKPEKGTEIDKFWEKMLQYKPKKKK